MIRSTVVEYLSKLYCICVIWTSQDIDQITLQSSTLSTDSNKLVWLNVGNDQQDVNEKVRLGINVGCQVLVDTDWYSGLTMSVNRFSRLTV